MNCVFCGGIKMDTGKYEEEDLDKIANNLVKMGSSCGFTVKEMNYVSDELTGLMRDHLNTKS